MYTLFFILLFFCVCFFCRNHTAGIFNFNISKQIKRYIIIPFIVLLLIFFSLSYLKYDKQQYDYGFGCLFCETKLPYYLKPNVDRYYTFTLLDDDDFELVGNGFRYSRSNFEIKSFLGYGYNDTSIIVKCTDSLNNIKYLISYETDYKSKKGNQEISFENITEAAFEQSRKDYRWVDIDEKKAGKVRFYRSLSTIGVITTLSLLLWQFIKVIMYIYQIRKESSKHPAADCKINKTDG